MKLKILGIPIIEYQPHEPNSTRQFSAPEFPPANDLPFTPPQSPRRMKPPVALDALGEIPNQKSLKDLFTDSAESLPKCPSKNNGRRLNIEACLDLYGITDPNELWNHDFKKGSAGHSLRAALGASGYRSGTKMLPTPAVALPSLTASQLANRENLTPEILPRLPNGKLDVESGLKLLNIDDPDELWQHQTKFGTALHLLKQTIGSKKYHRAGAAQGGKL